MCEKNQNQYPQLDESTNFHNWKFRLCTLLEEKGVEYTIQDKIDKENKSEYKKDDAKARGIIVQCLPDKYLEIIRKCDTAGAMLAKLKNIFERKSVFNKLHLKKQLLALKCGKQDKLQDHFLKFDCLIAKLETMGSTMEESDKVCHLLLTMSEDYDTVITTLETMDKELDMEFVKSGLLDAELKIKGKVKENTSEANLYNITCYKCGKEGHKYFECKTNNNQSYRGNRGRNRRSTGRILCKDLGEVEKFLGMEIIKKGNVLKITQTGIIDKILEKFKMTDANISKTPILKGFQVEDTEIIEDVPFRQLIGCLMFVTTVSRPDISYATSFLSQYLDKPTKSLWIQAKRVLRYLKGTRTCGLMYEKNEEKEDLIETFSDADWGGNHSDRKSLSGSVTFYNGNIISWFSRKQNCVALSTTEAEYIAAAVSACDLLYVKRLYFDLNQNVTKVPCILYIDNRGALQLIKSFENSKRAKHIDIKTHFVKDLVNKGEFAVEYVQSDFNLADIFTKSLCNEKFNKLNKLLMKLN